MKKQILLLLLFTLSCSFLPAQNTAEVKQITDTSQGWYFFPKFSPDGSKIYFTQAAFKGIFEYDIHSKLITQLTDEQGAGYEFAVSDNGEIYFRSDKYENGRKFSSLKVIDINTKNIETIEADKRELSTPCIQQNGRVVYTIQKNLHAIENPGKVNVNQSAVSEPIVFIEDSKISFYDGGVKKILAPLGDGNYIWPSLSPDRTKLLFTLAGSGTYVSDLNGNIVAELGYANAPVWSADNKWIAYMVDRDDGENVTSSELFVVSADGLNKMQLTNTADVHEMYPQFSPEGDEIVFHSTEGKIYLLKLNITE